GGSLQSCTPELRHNPTLLWPLTRPPGSHTYSTRRGGAATLDYVLVLGVIVSLAALMIPMSRHAITVVYDIICTLVAWPFV
ncbi:MAG: hypothetical protein QF363_18090, partial [Planctomycetaceae bacterium]|nr:hypothetical protein [Planctomycetaceae bacterium]